MATFIIVFFTALLVLVCLLTVLVVLMQKPVQGAGLSGSVGGGGAVDSALGAQSGNVLSRATILFSVLFFVVTLGLYLGHMARYDEAAAKEKARVEELRALGKSQKADAVDVGQTGTMEALLSEAPRVETGAEVVEPEAVPVVDFEVPVSGPSRPADASGEPVQP